ncbi:MAG: hypothetical protein H6Q90_375 [Deltaproteobacteria bacterium]|nr:hypothetical protein [Deltaproteobacteria bacterium]
MQNPDRPRGPAPHDDVFPARVPAAERPSRPWHVEVGDLLAQAALLCVEHDLDVDAFMKGAWSAYVEARPGLRDYLEDLQLRNQLEELRKLGRMGEA